MNKKQAILKYSNEIPPEILSSYKDADKTFTINSDDPDLTPITISLPTPPDWKLIDGFSLPAQDQIFQYAKYPQRLKKFEAEVEKDLVEKSENNRANTISPQKILVRIWKELARQSKDYYEEIQWIKNQWWHICYGYWFFCNGKPTYIDGWHYAYLNYWDMGDLPHPEYRDVNRDDFLFNRFAYTCTQDEKGNDLGYRICFGTAHPKGRRYGDTFMSLCIGWEIVTKVMGGQMGIQSFDNDNAFEHYNTKLLNAFDKKPFFLKPMWRGFPKPEDKINFDRPPQIRSKVLGGFIDYAKTANASFYDGKKKYFLEMEEEGKTILEDVNYRWSVLKPVLSLGAGKKIIGFSTHPTTCEEMTDKGGAEYKLICDASHFYQRINGQTSSGLFVHFRKAWYGLENFIGKYGESIVDTPTPEQAKYLKSIKCDDKMGAKEYILTTLENFKLKKDYAGYQSYLLKYPISYASLWQGKGGDTGLNTVKLNEAYNRIERLDNATIRGNFKWSVNRGGIIEELSAKQFLERGYHNDKMLDCKVVWQPDTSESMTRGRWSNSLAGFPEQMSNLKKWNSVSKSFEPTYPEKFTGSTDPYQFLNSAQALKRKDLKRYSSGGGCWIWERDYSVDPEGKSEAEWESYRTILTYDNRPDDIKEYCEEMLMTDIFLGAMQYPENNIKEVIRWYFERGYWGYLLCDMLPNGKFKPTPGYAALKETNQERFNEAKRYVEHHMQRERHKEIVLECKEILGVDDLTNHDLFCAWTGCLLGSSKRIRHLEVMRINRQNETQTATVEEVFGQEFNYN